MGKIRINELARELEVKAHEILEKLPELGVADKKTHSSSLDDDVVYKLRRYYGHEDAEPPSGGELETAPPDRPAVHAEPASVSNGQPKFQPVVDVEAAPAAHAAPAVKRHETPHEEPPAAERERPAAPAMPIRPPIATGRPIHPPIGSHSGAPRSPMPSPMPAQAR